MAMSVAVLFVPQDAAARLASNNRRAVVLEAFYALRPSHDGSCDKTINGNCVSSWNYLANDSAAYKTVNGWYRCDSSLWAVPDDKKKDNGCISSDLDYRYVNFSSPVSFYSKIESYGYGAFGGSYGAVGRGGECKFFANLILDRSGADVRRLPPYQVSNPSPKNPDMLSNSSTDWSKVKEGDVIFSLLPHTAIVVEVKKDKGNVTGVDVIDSNYISDSGAGSREVIGRHQLGVGTLQSYRIWKGVSYYSETYKP